MQPIMHESVAALFERPLALLAAFSKLPLGSERLRAAKRTVAAFQRMPVTAPPAPQ